MKNHLIDNFIHFLALLDSVCQLFYWLLLTKVESTNEIEAARGEYGQRPLPSGLGHQW